MMKNKNKPKQLSENVIIDIMKEEWGNKINLLSEQVELVLDVSKENGSNGELISPWLKVTNKLSGIRFTVVSVSPEDCVLKSPEGKEILVNASTLEDEYELA